MKSLNTLLAAGLLGVSLTAQASELTFQFTNPSFGGNPLNSAHLLGIAGSINDYDDPDFEAFEPPSELEQLAATLQSTLIGDLLFEIRNGNTGSVSTDKFAINVLEDSQGGLTVQISDLTTGESTSINVSNLIQ